MTDWERRPFAEMVPDTGVAAEPLEQVLAYVRAQALHHDVEAAVMDLGAPFEVEVAVSELRAVAVRLAAEVERLRAAVGGADYAEVRMRLDAEAVAVELCRIADEAGAEVTGEAADVIDLYLPAKPRSHLGAFERDLDFTDEDLRDVRRDMGEGTGDDLER